MSTHNINKCTLPIGLGWILLSVFIGFVILVTAPPQVVEKTVIQPRSEGAATQQDTVNSDIDAAVLGTSVEINTGDELPTTLRVE